MITAAALVLLVALLIQNVAEWRGGGPLPPLLLQSILSHPPQHLSAIALILVSLTFAVLTILALMVNRPGLLAVLAGGCLLNAIAQAVQSLHQRRWLPGTLSGLLLMAPAAIWLLLSLPLSPGTVLLLTLVGAAITPVLLVLTWLVADRAVR